MDNNTQEIIKNILIAFQSEKKIKDIENYLNNNKNINKEDILNIINGGDEMNDYF